MGEMETGKCSSLSPLSLMAHGFLVLPLVAAEEGSNTTAIAWLIHSLSNDSCHSLLTSSGSSVGAQPRKYGDYGDKKDLK